VKIRNLLLALCGAALACASVKPAAASPFTYDVTFSASNFSDVGNGQTPLKKLVVGEFHLTINPVSSSSGTAGLAVDFVNLTLSETLAYEYNAVADELSLAGNPASSLNPAGDLVLIISGFTSANPILDWFTYTNPAQFDSYFQASLRLVTVTAAPAAVTPIPAALPLFISALGGLGYLGWRRRKSAAA